MKQIEQNSAMSRDTKIAKVIREGHEIAEKLRKVQSVQEFDELDPQIDGYTVFVDENFGTIDKDAKLPRKESSLTRFLSILVLSKLRTFGLRNEKDPVFKRDADKNFNEFKRYLDSQDWAANIDTSVESDEILENLSLSRDKKIAMIIAEGHAIAEKMKKINDIRELDAMNGRVSFFVKYVNQEFGERADGFSNLSSVFLDVDEDKERQILFYPDKTDISSRIIEQEFESYLDSDDWYLRKSAR